MAQIKEDYVSFETAKLLKEKGFKGLGNCFYEKGRIIDFNNYWWRITPKERYDSIQAPTLQMAMKWLRKEHHLNIIVDCYTDNAEARIMTIEDLPACKCRGIIGEKYEEACEAAIKYCFENLI